MSVVFLFGPFSLSLKDRLLLRDGQIIPLAPKELDTLLVLVENPGHLIEKEELIARVWPDTFVGDGSLARNISVLRKSLGHDLIQTAPKRGYRFNATVKISGQAEEAPASGIDLAQVIPKSRPGQHLASAFSLVPPIISKPFLIGFVAVAIVVLGSLFGFIRNHPASASRAAALTDPKQPLKMAVLPFLNLTGNAQEDYLCDGLTEAMISELSRLSPDHLSVIARTSAMHYKKTAESVPQIARELGVDYLLESSVRSSGNRVRITAQLVRAADAMHVWTGEYERDLKDILDIQQQVAIAVADEIQLKLTQVAEARLRRNNDVNPEAYRYYQLGRFYLRKRTKPDTYQALEYFRRAIHIDHGFAVAYAGLADAYMVLGGSYMTPREAYAKGREAAIKALGLDNTLAEAFASLGYQRFIDEWDWAGADQAFQQSIALDPNYATAHHWYALYLAAMRRPDEAIREIHRALELDPLSLPINQNAGFVYLQANQYDEAFQQLRKALEINPDSEVAHGYLALAHKWKGEYSRALAELETARKLSGNNDAYRVGVAEVEALMGEKAPARSTIHHLIANRTKEPFGACSVALIYSALKEKNEAFQWLQQAIEDRSCTATEINNSHDLDPLRSDTRFAAMRRELRLDGER